MQNFERIAIVVKGSRTIAGKISINRKEKDVISKQLAFFLDSEEGRGVSECFNKTKTMAFHFLKESLEMHNGREIITSCFVEKKTTKDHYYIAWN